MGSFAISLLARRGRLDHCAGVSFQLCDTASHFQATSIEPQEKFYVPLKLSLFSLLASRARARGGPPLCIPELLRL